MQICEYHATSSKPLFTSSRSQISHFIISIDADFKYLSTGVNLIEIDLQLVKLCYEYSKVSTNSAALEKNRLWVKPIKPSYLSRSPKYRLAQPAFGPGPGRWQHFSKTMYENLENLGNLEIRLGQLLKYL
jgi:hypothetical protein